MGRIYSMAAWHRARRRQIARTPYCEKCHAQGRIVAAQAVHHREPIKDRPDLAYCQENLQCLCLEHHNAEHGRGTARTYSTEIDPRTGYPRDPNHPFNFRP